MNLFSQLAKKLNLTHDPAPPRPGLTLCLLQRRLERYTTERLNAAMQAAWGRAYDRTTFFGMNLDDENGLIKFNELYIPIYYHEHRLGAEELGASSLPGWADHSAFSRIDFVPGGEGLPTSEARHAFCGFIGLLAVELANELTTAFFYKEDGVFLRRDRLTREMILASDKSFDPHSAA
ncbi:hypothetical protein SAMN05421770_105222 [Granulicella rosea]|uniref:Uncharacterized protein n=1 Tax=Granulicella rosea TaxID=474952 RepID=A0A239KUR5_9BACT|nr:hypothetical protein [Granulicella rosea]SNT21805.1 hypothetical protein SAMN05421770_105222 [Granulicella rosea]